MLRDIFFTIPHLDISCEHIPLVVVGGTEGQEVLTALAEKKLLFFFFYRRQLLEDI